MRKIFLSAVLLWVVLFCACKKTEVYKTASINDYAPLVIGKYISYNLDSLIFADNINPVDRVISYQVKHLIEDTVTDNLGRKVFRMVRFLRKKTADNWTPDNTFFVVNTGNSLEFVENNFRFLKLKEPIVSGNSWKGNTYIDTYSATSEVKYYDDWNYTYDSLNIPLKLGSITVDSTLKVAERDDILGNPSDPATYSEINFSVSNYGKGIGLVYHRFIHQEYQPPTQGPKGYKVGYGITLTMIDHN